MQIPLWLAQHPEYVPEAVPIARGIWRLTHNATGQRHRLKVATDAKAIYFLQQEARWLSRLNDERFGRCHQLFQWQKQTCLLSDFIAGQTLTEVVRAGELNTETAQRNVFTQCIALIETLHEKGIVHGDIKPNNLIIHSEQVTLIDFANAGWVGRPLATRAFSCLQPTLLPPRFNSGQWPLPDGL